MKATLYFQCGDCQAITDIHDQSLTIGRNTADITCSQCGVQWHIIYTVLALSPLTFSSNWEMSRPLGIIKDGVFFGTGKVQPPFLTARDDP